MIALPTIPVDHYDKITVLKQLAEGASTRAAIKGISIKSNSTAARIARSESNAIAQHRETYLVLMKQKCDVTLDYKDGSCKLFFVWKIQR